MEFSELNRQALPVRAALLLVVHVVGGYPVLSVLLLVGGLKYIVFCPLIFCFGGAFFIQGVPAARQKLMAKGAWKGILKDDVDLSGCTIKDGQQVSVLISQVL